jgi:hypothetical protein
MNAHITGMMFSTVGFVVSVTAIIWSIVRVRYDRTSLPLEYLAHQARPQKKSVSILLSVAALLLVAAFLADWLQPPLRASSVVSLLAVSAALFSQVIQLYFRRVRALEAIVRISQPDLYFKIRSE